MHAAILEKGIAPLQNRNQFFQTPIQIQKKLQQKGRIISPPQFHAGFNVLMKQLTLKLAEQVNVTVMNHPDDIMLAFDKFNCQRQLQLQGIPVPPSLGEINDYDQLREQMRTQGVSRVFIKLKHGSAASGIIALETSGKKIQIKTSIEYHLIKQGKSALFNTRKIRKSNNETDISLLVDTLCKMEVYVERWIPKAQIKGYNSDLRILMIGGKAQHQVLRMSQSPITNLHLLNQRADVSLLKQRMTKTSWDSMIHSCEQVARLFSKSLYIALDVVVSISLKQHFILEVNAFGDLLKDIYFNGLTPQEAEIIQLKNDYHHLAV